MLLKWFRFKGPLGMYEVQKKIPVPKMLVRGRRGPTRKYPFETMKKGDMFFVPGKKRNTIATHVSTVGKELGVKFTSRLCYMYETMEGWKPCESTFKGAVMGVGVWRIE